MPSMFYDPATFNKVVGVGSVRSLDIQMRQAQSKDPLITNAIRHAIDTYWFKNESPRWNRLTTVGRGSKNTLNQHIRILKNNSSSLKKLFDTKPQQGIGPGEVMMMYLVEDSYLAGTDQSGDLRLSSGGTKAYEVKAAKRRAFDNSYSQFGLGSPSFAATLTFKQELESGTAKSGSIKFAKYDKMHIEESKGGWIAEAKKNGEWNSIVQRYRQLSKTYFDMHPMIIIDKDTYQIVHIGKINANMVHPGVYAKVGGFQPRIYLNGAPS